MTTPTMRAWGMETNTEKIEDLALITMPVPTPAAGEVRVKVLAVTTNPVDFKRVYFPAAFPAAFGVDGVGLVDAVGEGVASPAVGDRVHFFNNVMLPNGSFAPYTTMRAAAAVPVPKAMSTEDAAVVPCAGWTAYEALVDRLRVSAGMTVIINAASGGVGHLAVQLAMALGARVIAVCSGDEWCGKMRAMGCALVIDYRTQDIVQEVQSFTNNVGADCALDVVDNDTAIKLIKALRFGGGIVHIAATITAPDALFTAGITTHHVFIPGHYFHGGDVQLKKFAEYAAKFDAFVVSGKVKPIITARLSFEDVKTQLLAQAEGRVKGKVLITL